MGKKDCVSVGANNLTFCDVTRFWEPRSWIEDHKYLLILIPTGFSIVVYLSFIAYALQMFKSSYETFKSRLQNLSTSTDIDGWVQKWVLLKLLPPKAAMKV